MIVPMPMEFRVINSETNAANISGLDAPAAYTKDMRLHISWSC